MSTNTATASDKKAANKSDSFQALRGICFLGVFLSHAQSTFTWGILGVCIFFVLSGFLMTTRYMDREIACSIKDNAKFSIKKIGKLYFLHIFTMLFAIVLRLIDMVGNGLSFRSVAAFGRDLFLNVTLLQTWYPKNEVNVSLNGVSWFLSTMMFLYFMFPLLIKWIRKIESNLTLIAIPLIIVLVQIGSIYAMACVFGYSSSICKWFSYFLPVLRLGDFAAGCCLGKLYKRMPEKSRSIYIYSILEILLLAVSTVFYIWVNIPKENVLLQSISNQVSLYIPFAMLWVLAFAASKGIVTKILTNRFFIFLGNISSLLFLIHHVIIMYSKKFFDVFSINLNGVAKYSYIFVEFWVTLALTVLYRKVSENIAKKKVA